MRNWAYTHSFHDTVDIISQCCGKEIPSHLIMALTNTTDMPPKFIS